MARYKRSFTPKMMAKRIREGRGVGYGGNYKPWLTVRDVPSKGLSSRILGWKTGRVHHLLSINERSYFFILEWSIIVIDIREQFPLLPLEATLEIANRLGIKHPTDPVTQLPIVMTTDFLIDYFVDGKIQKCARTFKQESDVSDRTAAKFQIERVYWEEREIDWGIVTEQEIDEQIATNVKWIHKAKEFGSLTAVTKEIFTGMEHSLRQMPLHNYRSLAEIGTVLDKSFDLPTGCGLWSIRHLIANRRWIVDMKQPLNKRTGISFSIGFCSTDEEV